MRKTISIIVLLLIVSCSSPVGECRILDSDFIPMIKGNVDGESFYFLIDTGASISIIDKEQFKRYFPTKRLGQRVENTVTGFGGAVNGMNEIRFEVKSGSLTFKKGWKVKDIKSIIRAVKSRTGKNVIGIIGNNNLKNLIIDLKNDVIYYEQIKQKS